MYLKSCYIIELDQQIVLTELLDFRENIAL